MYLRKDSFYTASRWLAFAGSTTVVDRHNAVMTSSLESAIGLYRENAITIESEARYPNGGNVYYVTMQITFHIPEFARKERTFAL